jgi:hypothetical protein
MLFNDYTKTLPTLASMVYLLSEEFAEGPSAPADAAALDRIRRRESMEKSAQAGLAAPPSLAEQNAQEVLLQAIRDVYVSDSAMQSTLNAKRRERGDCIIT